MCAAYMTAAVRAVLPFAFGTLRLHRVEAACIQRAVHPPARRCGFRAQGYARYLCINGIWQVICFRPPQGATRAVMAGAEGGQFDALGLPSLGGYEAAVRRTGMMQSRDHGAAAPRRLRHGAERAGELLHLSRPLRRATGDGRRRAGGRDDVFVCAVGCK